jgi:geranylgeranyl diphosphate synthase type I
VIARFVLGGGKRLHGNADLDAAGAAALRHTIMGTGALGRVEDMIEDRTAAALDALDRAAIADEARVALGDLAILATRRQT